MIIWSGLGFLAALIPFIFVLVFGLLSNVLFGQGYMTSHNWPIGLALLISAVLVFFLGIRLERPGKTLIDPQTGRSVVLRRRNTLFFIPIKYWAGVWGLASLFFFVWR